MKNRSDHTLRYKHTAPARTEELREVRDAVEREAIRFGFDSETAFRVALAVDEACANIIEHAYKGIADSQFSVEITTHSNQFVVTLYDSGKGYRPDRLPRLDIFQRAREHRHGGLGLHIINIVMDAVDYGVAPDRSNCLRLVKYLNGASH